MRLVFEISHLRTATPATVSRAGSHCFSVFVSYFSSQYCGFIWLILKRAFSARLGYRLLQQPQTHRGQKGPSVSTFFWSVDCLFVRCWFVHTCLQHWRQRCVQLYLKLSFYDKKLCVLSGSMWQFICMMHYFIVCWADCSVMWKMRPFLSIQACGLFIGVVSCSLTQFGLCATVWRIWLYACSWVLCLSPSFRR